MDSFALQNGQSERLDGMKMIPVSVQHRLKAAQSGSKRLKAAQSGSKRLKAAQSGELVFLR